MWTAILNILIIYVMIPPDDLPKSVSTALIYLSVSVVTGIITECYHFDSCN